MKVGETLNFTSVCHLVVVFHINTLTLKSFMRYKLVFWGFVGHFHNYSYVFFCFIV